MKKQLTLAGFWLAYSWIADRRISDPRPVACRAEFSCRKDDGAVIRISSCEYYALFVNGIYAGSGPARSVAMNKRFDEVDISALLKDGENALALLVTMPTGEISHRGRAGWWCDCHDKNGNLLCCTDNSWRCAVAWWYDKFCEPRSLSSARQEHIYCEKAEPGWQTLPVSGLSEAWKAPFVLGKADWTPPYRKLQPRATAMQQRVDLPLKVAGVYTAASTMFPIDALADSFNALEFKRQADRDFSGKITAGEVWVFDLGKTRTFIPRIKIVRGSSRIRLESYCDIRHNNRPQATSPMESAGAGFADSWSLADGEYSGELLPTVPYGGRFWSLRAAGSGECEIALQLQSLEYPYPQGNFFRSKDAELEKFFAIADQTVRSATQEVFVDTCWREQALWTRDAAVAGKSAFYLYGDLAVWKESLKLVGESISSDGVPCAVVPAEVSHVALPDQTFSWIMALEDYYLISGDRRFIAGMRQKVMAFLHLMREYVQPDGLFAPPVWSWHFVDWAEVDRRPWSLAINAMLYAAVVSAEKLYSSNRRENKFLSGFAALCRQGLDKFWDGENGFFINHLDGADDSLGKTIFYDPQKNCPEAKPVHGNALLLARGLFPEKYRSKAAEAIAAWLKPLDLNVRKFNTSWLPTVTQALLENGQSETAWELLRARCGGAVTVNAPTYGEEFPFREFNSAHGWSAGAADFLAEQIWGIRILEAGFKKIALDPVPSIPDSEVYLQTPGGIVHLQMRSGKLIIVRNDMEVIGQ